MTLPTISSARLVSFCLLLLLLCGQALTITPVAQAAGATLTNAALSTVIILALDRNNESIGHGSGVLITAAGLVLTNYHVVEANQRRDGRLAILVPNSPTASQAADFTWYWGAVQDQGTAPTADLALVQIDLMEEGDPLPANLTFPFLPLGDSDQVGVDEEIHILGYPGIANGSLITLQGRIIGMQDEDGLPWLLTDATIASGNSGGAAINAAGELIGIPTITVNDERSGNTIGYLRPINLAKALVTAGASDPDRIFCADDFTSNKQGWLLGFDDRDLLTSETVLAGGVYQKFVHFKQDGAYTWSNAPDCEVKNFYMYVDATVLSKSDADTGIVLLLRNQEANDESDHYRVIFYFDNSYEIDVYHKGEWQTLAERTATSRLALDSGSVHRLAILAVGTQLTVYVNGEEIATVFDDTLTSGGIGLGLIGNTDQAIEVTFDNFYIGEHRALGVIFYDFFVDNHNEWQLGRTNDADVDCEDRIVDGRLVHQLKVKNGPSGCYSTAPGLYAADFWLQLDAIWLQRYVEGSWLELSFRHDLETGQQYTLRLSQDGYYLLEKYDQDEWHTLQDWTQSIAIERGRRQKNTIELRVHDPYITLTVNGVELTTIEDEQMLAAGQITPGIFGETGVNTTVAFDNLIVWETLPPTE